MKSGWFWFYLGSSYFLAVLALDASSPIYLRAFFLMGTIGGMINAGNAE